MKTFDPWKDDVAYGGKVAQCGKAKCKNDAVLVGFASPSHRVVCCAEHEDELKSLVYMIRRLPVPVDLPPTETVQWRRDDR